MIFPEPDVDFVSGGKATPATATDLIFLFRSGALLQTRDDAGSWRPATREELTQSVFNEHFLGEWRGTACYAAETDPEADGDYAGLRTVFDHANHALFVIAGRAQQILDWYRSHRYCGKCGGRNEAHSSDRAMVCPACRLTSYPRLSPSIIVLVHDEDRVLLARNHRFPAGMYSTLAGFVEPGESIEETLRREVKEEVGVDVEDLRYLGSQPWPFPNSLMLGFHARYAGGEIALQEDEIADARWFPCDALPEIPPRLAISRWLIDTYLAERGVPVQSYT